MTESKKGGGGDNENGPKQRVLRRLGHSVSFFFFFFIFLRVSFMLTNVLLYIQVLFYEIHDGVQEGRWGRRERAQTTRPWATLVCFFLFIYHIILVLTNVYI